jgi:hypothetical protein
LTLSGRRSGGHSESCLGAVGGKQYVATTSGVVSGFFGGSGTSAIIVFALN